MKNITQKTIVVGIIALVIGFILGWFVAKEKYLNKNTIKEDSTLVDENKDESTLGTENTQTVTTGAVTNTEGEGSVLVASQKAGDSVTVETVTAQTVSWVAIREYNNGIMGNILGAKRVEAGTHSNVVVPLLRATKPGATYYAVLFKDNGDGMFNKSSDMMIEQEGKVISQPFLTDTVSQ